MRTAKLYRHLYPDARAEHGVLEAYDQISAEPLDLGSCSLTLQELVRRAEGSDGEVGEVEAGEEVKYIHGNLGRGTFTFYGGHDPEDYQHFVYDPPTQLSLHKNSPGYRLILNNILFPAAKKKKRKT